jgi:hypothetical protein
MILKPLTSMMGDKDKADAVLAKVLATATPDPDAVAAYLTANLGYSKEQAKKLLKP